LILSFLKLPQNYFAFSFAHLAEFWRNEKIAQRRDALRKTNHLLNKIIFEIAGNFFFNLSAKKIATPINPIISNGNNITKRLPSKLS
jgi:hypothetical protein